MHDLDTIIKINNPTKQEKTADNYNYKIVIPYQDNDGVKFNKNYYQSLLKKAQQLGITGGTFQKPSSALLGFWFDDKGKLYQENNGYFTTTGGIELKNPVRQLAKFAKKLFRQKNIFFETLPSDVEFI